MINREKVKAVFKSYTDNYNSADGKIRLKIDHTYRVAKLCDRICDSVRDGICHEPKMTGVERDIAWLIGMLHDIGRFEQVRRYGTFADAVSVDHAELSADILFKEGLINDFIEESDNAGRRPECFEIIEKAIRAHNKYRIPEEYDGEVREYARIIRDADKIDILKVNVEVPQEVIYNVTTEELMNAPISDEVFSAFNEEHCILRSLKKTPMDNLIGHLSLIFELEYPISYRIVKEQGYYLKALEIIGASNNPKTRELTEPVRERVEKYIAGHGDCHLN